MACSCGGAAKRSAAGTSSGASMSLWVHTDTAGATHEYQMELDARMAAARDGGTVRKQITASV